MAAQQTRLDTVANNLANVSTTGFRSTRIDLTDKPLERFEVARAGSGEVEATEIGAGVDVIGTSHSFAMGGLQVTNRPTDMAIVGNEGFFQVRLENGSIAYTRDGGFSVDAGGRLVTSAGDAVEPPVTLLPGTTISHVTGDGQIMGTVPGGAALQVVGQIQLAQFANPNGLQLIGGNRFQATDASGEPLVGRPGDGTFPQIASGVLEGSNVDFAEQATTMIDAQRAYSMNLKAVQTLDDMIGQAIQLRS
jgi:flagellar basal-body rod protein FlgG